MGRVFSKPFVLTVASCATVCVTFAAAVSSAQPNQASPYAVPEGAPDTLVKSRERDNAAEAGLIKRRGAEGRLTAMRAIVRAHFRRLSGDALGIRESEKLPSLDAEQVALYLTTLGYDPSTLQSSGNARAIVTSAQNVLFGRSTINDAVTVSPTVIVGSLQRVAEERSNDGYYSTAHFKVVQTLKGPANVGSEIALRQRSGPRADGSIRIITNEYAPGMTGEYLLFVSPEAYRIRSLSDRSEPSFYVEHLLPYQVREGRAFATAPGQNSNNVAITNLTVGG